MRAVALGSVILIALSGACGGGNGTDEASPPLTPYADATSTTAEPPDITEPASSATTAAPTETTRRKTGEDLAIQIALDRVGDCLKNAGWDTTPEHVKEASSPAPADDTWRIVFQSESDAEEFLRLAVNTETREILAYGDEDRHKLADAGCAV